MNRTSFKHCAACRVTLPAGSPRWMALCRPCFVAARKAEREALLAEVSELRAEVARLRCRPALDGGMLRTLLQLSHPDRHGNSRAATRATQFLLTLKREAANA